jgi:FtsZ-interacting cell division protein ZipA
MENNEKKVVFNINKNTIINVILIIALCILGWQNFQQSEMIDEQTVQLSSKNTDDNKHTTIVYEQKLETLKKTNKELYDSLKIYKDEIDYLAQFKHTKEYVVHEVIKPIEKNDESADSVNVKVEEEIKEFVYENKEPNDTLNYQLRIGSTVEPNWYSINFKVSETFTLVNKEVNGINETTIAPSTGSGVISNVTVLKQKEKFKLKDRIAIGPSVTAGYCLINKKVDVMVGVSVTFDLW